MDFIKTTVDILHEALNIIDKESSKDNRMKIDLLRRLGEYEAAFKLAQESCDDDPIDFSRWLALGLIKEDQGRYLKAFDYYSKAYELAPDEFWPILDQANALQKLGRFHEAEAKILELIEKFPIHHEVKINLVTIYIDMGRFEEAEELCYALLEQDLELKYRIDIHLQLGKIKRHTDRPLEALYHYNAILNHYPNIGSVLIELAITLRRVGRAEEAFIYFRRLREANPTSMEPWFYLALIYAQRREWETALESVETALILKPNDPRALDLQAQIWFHQERKTEAIDQLEARLNQKSDYKTIQTLLELLTQLDEQSDKIQHYQSLLAKLAVPPDLINPTTVHDYSFRPLNMTDVQKKEWLKEGGESLVNRLKASYAFSDTHRKVNPNEPKIKSEKLGRLLESTDRQVVKQKFKSLTRDFPDSTFHWNNFGQSLLLEGNLEDALQAFEKSLTIEPDNLFALNRAAVIYGKLGRYEDALHYINQGLGMELEKDAIYSREKELLLTLKAKILYLMGNKREAKELCIESWNRQIKSATLCETWTIICLEEGQEKEALQTLEKWLELEPNNPYALDLLLKITSS